MFGSRVGFSATADRTAPLPTLGPWTLIYIMTEIRSLFHKKGSLADLEQE